jgi:hypothetical protein
MAVLTASAADIEHHLSVLPSSLHPLAIEVAFPSIRRDRSLTLDFASLRKLSLLVRFCMLPQQGKQKRVLCKHLT